MSGISIDSVKKIELPQYGDERGHLVIGEGNRDIPFEIKRIFYIYGADKETVRGQHANRKSEFVLINVAGSSKVRVIDNKGNEKEYLLSKPNEGLFIPAMIWKDMYCFSEDAVLLVLSNEHYDANEYIRDFKEFQE